MTKWSPEHRWRRLPAAVYGGKLGLDTISGYRMQIRACLERKLTLSSMMCSVKLTMVGDELMVTNSGGLLREESDQLA
jgi:hypothetical protein